MSANLDQYKEEIAKHSQRLDEVAKLKTTLTSISKAIKPASSEISSSSYKVKAGDTLEKIARRIQCTAEEIRHLNQLQNDKIVVGQDLKVPTSNHAEN
jgi:LysM repeat protein